MRTDKLVIRIVKTSSRLEVIKSESVVEMGDDVWLEVLKRVPSTKDIVRCMCVCRSWYTLVASPFFINQHLDSKIRNTNGDHLLLLLTHDGSSLRSAAGFNNGEQAFYSVLNSKGLSPVKKRPPFCCPIVSVNSPCFQLVGSVHGIICVLDASVFDDPARDVTLLWNPAVCRYIRLQPPPSNIRLYDSSSSSRRLNYLCFPRFTFDPITKDLLVVRVVYCYFGTHTSRSAADPIIEFYSVGDREWKTVPNAAKVLLPTRKKEKRFSKKHYHMAEESCSQYRSSADGTVCWIAWREWISVLVLFSAVERQLKTLALPEETVHRMCPVRSRVVEYRGLLSFIEVTSCNYTDLAYNIWSWCSNQDQWCKMDSADTSRMHIGMKTDLPWKVLMLTDDNQLVTEDGDRTHHLSSYVESLLLLDRESGSISYDPTTYNPQIF